MKKRMSILLCGLMAVMMMCSVMTFSTKAAGWEPEGVWVGETKVSDGGYWKTTSEGGLTAGTEDDYNVKYAEGHLTLNNATIKKAKFYKYTGTTISDCAAIYVSDGNLNIQLIGENKIVGTDNTEASSYGIYVYGDLSIYGTQGTESLEVTSGAAKSENGTSAAVFAKVITLSNCVIKANGNTGKDSYGLYTHYQSIEENRINIKKAQVTAKGNTCGVFVSGDTDITPKMYTVIYKLDACRTIVRFGEIAVGDSADPDNFWRGEGDNRYQRYGYANTSILGCKVFSVTYGHTWEEIVDDTHKMSAATCEKYAVYKKSCCICGAEHETETFEDVNAGYGQHTWTDKVEDRYKKSDATYEQAAVYYKSCSVCGTKHESDTFTYGSALVREEDDKNTGSQTPDTTPNTTPNTTPDTTPSQAPKTGDGANAAVWFVLCMVCGVSLVTLMKKKGTMAI